MSKYRIPELDLPTRISLALELLTPRPEREWGRVTELSCIYHISRTLLYEMRARALEAVCGALAAHPAGRPAQRKGVAVDRALIQRAIAALPTLTGSVRGIQQGLALLLGVQRSVGYISQTLSAAGAKASAYQASMAIPLPVLAEADEIFQGRQPCLTVVDGRSFLVLNLSPAAARDGATWGVTFLDLQARGIRFHDLASDGGQGILAGVREAGLVIPLRPDLFHLLREAHRIIQRLERQAYQAMTVAERARRAEREAQAPQRRRGKPLTVKVPRAPAEAQEEQAMRTHDLCVWLLQELRQALEPITPAGHLAAARETRATLQTVVELLTGLAHPPITALASKLAEQVEALVAPLTWLEQRLAAWRTELDSASEALILWAWQNRQALGPEALEGLPAALQPVAQAFAEALSLFHRSSSLAESLHSWLRPHLHIHRGMPKWLLPLLQLAWNHHTFERGQRAGHNPLELAGVTQAPSFAAVLEQLFHTQPTVQTA
jgi:hypothetical protein